ncbi:alpha/beta fold hydrolase, partial [Eggerthella sinensis]|uniref:alpha/beta fold hydrolase n=1 Tax=Eggerthella sinensis TaxID=242230 RepID=UPI003A4DA3B5
MQGSRAIFVHGGVCYGVARWGASAPAAASDAAPATPLILLHGFSQSAASWDDVAVRLAATRPVYALDLVGHGASD